MSARVEMLAGGAPPEPERFRPTQLQRYGLWIAGWVMVLGLAILLISLALTYLAHYKGPLTAWPVWYFPTFSGFIADVLLRGPIFPTPERLGGSRLKATGLWLLSLVLFPGAILAADLWKGVPFLDVAAILAIMGWWIPAREYGKLSGWQGYPWPVLRPPPREWAVKRDTAKLGGVHAG